MNADVLSTNIADGTAVITLGIARRIYFARVRSYEKANITSPSRSIEVRNKAHES
jgi:hypothetical protein